jgi:hypothetical protein
LLFSFMEANRSQYALGLLLPERPGGYCGLPGDSPVCRELLHAAGLGVCDSTSFTVARAWRLPRCCRGAPVAPAGRGPPGGVIRMPVLLAL